MNRRYIVHLTALIFSVLFLTTTKGTAQEIADTFNVTVADKTPEHPYYGQGYPQGYVINGEQSPTIYLVRGQRYLWNSFEATLDLVFDFYTIPIGGGEGFYRRHVYEHIVPKGLWYVQATTETPDTLYYACVDQPWMGGTILVVDSLPTTSVVSARGSKGTDEVIAGVRVSPNPMRTHAEISYSLEERSVLIAEIVDLRGRIVYTRELGFRDAGTGVIDVDRGDLASGMYYYRLRAIHEGQESITSGMLQIL